MTKRQAWWTLIEPPLTVALSAYLTWYVLRFIDLPSADDVGARITIDPTTVTDTQAAIITAAMTAVVGLLGTWSVKAREFRNGRADKAAEVALEFHATLQHFMDIAGRYDTDLEGANRRLREINKETALLRTRESQIKWSGAPPSVLASTKTQIEKLSNELKAIQDRIGLKELDRFFSRLEPALAHLRMYGTLGMAMFGAGALDKLAVYRSDPNDETASEKAELALDLFLSESRAAVTAYRRWWGRRLAHHIRLGSLHQFARWRVAIAVIRGQEGDQSVPPII